MAASRQSPHSSTVTTVTPTARHRRQFALSLLGLGAAAVIVMGASGTVAASASQPQVNLGTTTAFAVLAGTTVTNIGPSSIYGDLGLYPGTSVTGFPPGNVHNGSTYVAPSNVAKQAKADLTTAYNDAAGRTPTTVVSRDLGGQTLAPGVYKASSSIGLTGTVTLDGKNNPGSVFIFQAVSTLITASGSTVKLIDGAQGCNVFWQVGSSATLGTTTTFVGSVLALTSISLDNGATVSGRVLARNGAVTLDDNTITIPSCATTATTTTVAGTATTVRRSPTATTSASKSTTTTHTASGSATTTTSSGASSQVSSTTIPGSHTGEPWAGWPYWVLVSLAGFLGFAFVGREVSVRRRRT